MVLCHKAVLCPVVTIAPIHLIPDRNVSNALVPQSGWEQCTGFVMLGVFDDGGVALATAAEVSSS